MQWIAKLFNFCISVNNNEVHFNPMISNNLSVGIVLSKGWKILR